MLVYLFDTRNDGRFCGVDEAQFLFGEDKPPLAPTDSTPKRPKQLDDESYLKSHEYESWDGADWVKKSDTEKEEEIRKADPLIERKLAIQSYLDEIARQYGYFNIITAISYVGDPNAQFATEGAAFREWRSAVWVKALDTLAKYKAGEQLISIPDLIDSLPKLKLPKPSLPQL